MRPRRVDVDRMRRHQRRHRFARYVEADQRQSREITDRMLWMLTTVPKCDGCGGPPGERAKCPACVAVASEAGRVDAFGEPAAASGGWFPPPAFPSFYESNKRFIEDEMGKWL